MKKPVGMLLFITLGLISRPSAEILSLAQHADYAQHLSVYAVSCTVCSNAFFSETTNMIKAKLYMNVHWMVLYKVSVFYADRKSKMTATAGHRLT